MEFKANNIAFIGLGYVGLPLMHAFSEKYNVIGFDINPNRIKELKQCFDKTNELNSYQLKEINKWGGIYTSNHSELDNCNVFIITVPTPIHINNKPDFKPLVSASKLVGSKLKKGDIVIYESTVYPGATREICVPILEDESSLIFNVDFFCGYSPERINPGDKEHTVKKIKKVTSGSNKNVARFIDSLYSSVITAGTHLAPSIEVAEAAKVIENTQRDINIAFVNELAIIFNKLNINTNDVLEAAGTKWNFLNFKPGLVGGHCIGVDPYYLTYKAKQIGYKPEVILSGRRVNDNMAIYVANQVVKLVLDKGLNIKKAPILILGITFKENCPDIRNSKVFDLYSELRDFGANVFVSDIFADPEEVNSEYGINLIEDPAISDYRIVILAVPHDDYKSLSFNQDQIVYDIKSYHPDSIHRL